LAYNKAEDEGLVPESSGGCEGRREERMGNKRWLTVYLQDHYAAAVAGTALFHRVAGSHGDAHARSVIAELATQVEMDRRELGGIMRTLGIRHSQPKQAFAWSGEKVGRLKTNGSVFKRSPLTDVVELDALSLGVEGKVLCWKVLLTVAQAEPSLDVTQVEHLLDRAAIQRGRIEELRRASVEKLFGGVLPRGA
jgi:hypothetical protein